MKIVRGDCGHIKARWDNHHKFLKCSSCSRLSTYFTCSSWSEETWILADRRLTHAARKSMMTRKRQNKKKKRLAVTSDLFDDITTDGNTTPHGYTARGKTHQGGVCSDTEGVQRMSTSHWSPGSGQPFTGQWVTGQPVTGQPVTSQPVIGQPGTSQPGTGQFFTSQPGTGQPVTGHLSSSNRSLSDYQAPSAGHFITWHQVIKSLVTSQFTRHRSSYISLLIMITR